MKKVKMLGVLAAGVLTVAGLASCGGEKVDLTVWCPVEHTEIYKKFVEDFKATDAKYKDLNIKIGACGEGDAYGTLSKDVEGGADVYSFANDQLYNLIKVGGLAELGGDYKTFVETTNLEGMVNAAKKGDKLYAFPITADNGYFLYYNSDVVTKYDETTSFEEVAAQCAAKGKKFVVPVGDSWYGYGIFSGYGAKYEVTYDDKGKETEIKCDYNGEKGLKAGNFFVNLANLEGFQYADGGSSGDKSVVLNDYITAKTSEIGAVVVGTWKYAEISTAWGADKTNCTYLPLMTKGDATSRMRSFIGGKMVGVNKQSKNTALALQFAKFISDEAAQKVRFEKLNMGPSNINLSNSADVKANKAIAGLAAQVAKAGDPQINVPSTFWTAVQNFGAAACYKKEITAANLQTKLDQLVTDITTIAK
ncbi:MAG: extracellular solute-binding protein [Mollicutes bacterium]|nr:extracellular solute-binding protein [Mollicutes bacterium]MDD7263998.1 extracellular solute-binding protein [bacterium]MDY4979422.1 extracellular solute-binding protein [Candidatus Onthovivens sp.]